MLWEKLTPEIPNARARTSVPTFIRKCPLPLPPFEYFIHIISFAEREELSDTLHYVIDVSISKRVDIVIL